LLDLWLHRQGYSNFLWNLFFSFLLCELQFQVLVNLMKLYLCHHKLRKVMHVIH